MSQSPYSKPKKTVPDNGELLRLLRKLLGDEKAEFRPQQLRYIRRIAGGRDTLAILPTGAGKSVCYQVPGLYFDGLTIVITPLIALMRDQVTRLASTGVSVACISGEFCFEGENIITESSEMELSPAQRIYRNAASGKYKFLYVTQNAFRPAHSSDSQTTPQSAR